MLPFSRVFRGATSLSLELTTCKAGVHNVFIDLHMVLVARMLPVLADNNMSRFTCHCVNALADASSDPAQMNESCIPRSQLGATCRYLGLSLNAVKPSRYTVAPAYSRFQPSSRPRQLSSASGLNSVPIKHPSPPERLGSILQALPSLKPQCPTRRHPSGCSSTSKGRHHVR